MKKENPDVIKIKKQDIALTQLKSAVKMYRIGDYISCLTLSAAAEEILGKMMLKNKGSNWLKGEVSYLGSIYEYFGKSIPSEKVLIKKINKIKNSLKHNDSGENEIIEADFEDEAVLFFVKAVKNYYGTFNHMPKSRGIVGLFDELTQ